MVLGKKTFADMKIGEKLYFGALDCSHIMESTLVNIEMLTDDDNCYTFRSDVRFTPVEFGHFEISKLILDKNDAIYYEFNGNGFWCGTSPEVVATCVLKALQHKRDFWQSRINHFVNNI